ncbi:ABC transporter ATP-binding protein [Arthrobacter ginkgonis]|uniref:ABC transporter ATP-binding protein n=1 Tax=Arthrobacter ginkgonis TaxID=1630594 RepID=A0ABP7DEL5_9MICC
MKTTPVIQVRDVEMSYDTPDGTATILKNCDLQIREGEFISIVGRSGGGKTTLLRIVAGLLTPTAGEVTIKGNPVQEALNDLAMVFQKPVLLPWRNNIGNILLPLEFRGKVTPKMKRDAQDLLELVGLADAGSKYPYELSGGMQQRVAICRALVSHPQIMLMDEPFGALDAMTRDTMNLELQRIWAETGRSILFVTHSIPEAVFLSDRVVVIGDKPGRVIADIKIDLPRLRTREHRFSPEFAAYEHQVAELIGVKEGIS